MKLNHKLFFRVLMVSLILFAMAIYFLIGATHEFKLNLIPLSFAISFPIALFMAFHTFKNIKEETLIIDANNKDPKLGLTHYQEEIDSILWSFSYRKQANQKQGANTYVSVGRYLLVAPAVTVLRDPYQIEIFGPTHLLKVLKSHLNLKNSS